MTVILLAFSGTLAADCAPKWEKVNNPASYEQSLNISDSDGAEAKFIDGWLYVRVSKTTNTKVVTILGHPVAQAQLQPGVSRLRITTKGIYIVKIGSVTKRIVV